MTSPIKDGESPLYGLSTKSTMWIVTQCPITVNIGSTQPRNLSAPSFSQAIDTIYSTPAIQHIIKHCLQLRVHRLLRRGHASIIQTEIAHCVNGCGFVHITHPLFPLQFGQLLKLLLRGHLPLSSVSTQL